MFVRGMYREILMIIEGFINCVNYTPKLHRNSLKLFLPRMSFVEKRIVGFFTNG